MDIVAGAGLGLEYRNTTAKRSRGNTPGQGMLRFGDRMERVTVAATSLYRRCQRRPARPLRSHVLPLALFVGPILASVGLWFATSSLPVNSTLRFRIAQAEARWTSFRGTLGASVTTDPAPTVIASQRHPGSVSVRLACRSTQTCAGWLALERRDHRLHERYVKVTPHRQKIIILELRGNERWIAAHGQLKFKQP